MLPTPTIVVQLPRPLWQRLLQAAALVAGVALFGAASFRVGQHYPLAPLASLQATPSAQAAAPAAASSPAAPTTPAAPAAVAPLAAASSDAPSSETPKDGLELKALSLALDPEDPSRLRYRLTLTNSGRKFSGTLRFIIAGEREGKPEQWHHPATGEVPDPKFKVEVSRSLKTEGVITLPEGFAPRAATVDLLEPTGVRLSKQTRIGRPA